MARVFRGRSAAKRLAVRRRVWPAGDRHRQGRRAGPKPGKSAFPPRQSIQKRRRKRSERISQAYRRTVPKRLPQPATGGKASKAAAGQAAVVHCRGCVPAFVGRPVVRPRQGCVPPPPLHPPAGPPHSAALRSPDRRGTAAKILYSERELSEDAERPTAGSEKTRRNRPRANSAPGRAISPTSPTPAHNHTMHPQSTRRLAAARCRHTTAPARPRTNAGRDAWAKPRSTQQDFVKGDLADVGH